MNEIYFDFIRRSHSCSKEDVKKLLEISETTYREKTKGTSPGGFTQTEIKKLVDEWGLSAEQTFAMFFGGSPNV